MAAVRGIFTLNRVRLKSFTNEWTNLSDVWINQVSDTGYFGGGGTIPIATYYSITDKLTYSTETTVAAPSANLSSPRYDHDATGNSTDGYFAGGGASRMDKLTYSTDTTVYTPSANLSSGRNALAATGSSTAGYFGGGTFTISTMDKVTYSTDTTVAVPGANLSLGRSSLAAAGSSTAGYFGGSGSRMDKVTYSTDITVYTPSANLSVSRSNLTATGNSTHGYFGSGDPAFVRSQIDKITYSTDTTVYTPSANLLGGNRRLIGATGNSTAGYFSGGTEDTEKIDYSSDTTSLVPSVNLTLSRYFAAGVSSKENALQQNLWRRFSDGSTTSNPASLPPATPTPQTAEAPTPNTGYFGGSTNPSGPGAYSSTDKLTYTTDLTAAVPTANLSTAGYDLAATGNSDAGYFGGGIPNAVSRMDKLTYSTDITAAVPGANLSLLRYAHAATGNSIAGYFGGGVTPGPAPGASTTTEKLTYSIETTVVAPSANLSFPSRFRLAATGNSTSGYFGGGTFNGSPPHYSIVDKLTYSTDTTVYTPSANLSLGGRFYHCATGNSTTGYFGGGTLPGTVSTLEKLTYSTDTTIAAPSGANLNFTYARLAAGATGNLSNGYFGGGTQSSPISAIDKLTYSTETMVYTPSTNLSYPRAFHGTTSARENALPPTYPAPVLV